MLSMVLPLQTTKFEDLELCWQRLLGAFAAAECLTKRTVTQSSPSPQVSACPTALSAGGDHLWDV